MKVGKVVFASKKGSSLVNVLIAIAVMLILSSGLLLLTAKNSKLSQMVISKFDDYYDLERAAEETLKDIDERIEVSENKSLEYMKEQYYNCNTKVYDTVDLGKQLYFNNKYKGLKGNEELDKFLDEAFGRVYYINLQQAFVDGKHEKKKIKINRNKEVTVDFYAEANVSYAAIDSGTSWEEFKAGEGDTLFKITVEDNKGKRLKVVAKSKVPVYDTTRSVKITEASKANPIWANAITAKGSIKFLASKTNIYGDLFSSDNKLNMNTAITRGNKEGIFAEDSEVKIYGNVYSRGDFHIASGEKKTVVAVYKDSENKNKNVSVNRRCKNFILSNDSYYDDNILKGVKTSIDVDDISAYTDGEKRNADDKNFPFIFKDNNGGNVYCNDLSVENTAVEGSEVSINGNVWTNGSIINDSLYGKTKIQLNGAYVGLTSVNSANSENRGSCIVNNIYNTTDKLENMNKIVLTDKLIVPGVNFIDESGKNKYKTGESITCNFWDKDKMLNSYIKKDKEVGGNVSLNFRSVTTKNGKKSLAITPVDKLMSNINQDQNEQYKRFLKNVYKGDDDGVNTSGNAGEFITNIYMPNKYSEKKINGYCEGAAVLVEEKIHRVYLHPIDLPLGYGFIDYTIEGYDNNKRTYEKLEDIVKRIFESKTMNFGTENRNFDNSVDRSMLTSGNEDQTGIKFLSSGGEVTVNGNQESIIYSEGDLTITGEGTLKGTIICRGNVTIKGKVDFVYDEEVIKRSLKNHEATRNFFKPGETGKYCITKDTIEVDQASRKKKAPATYKIVEWTEGIKK